MFISLRKSLSVLLLAVVAPLAEANDEALHQWVDSLYEEAEICYSERSDYRGALALLNQIIPVCEQAEFTDEDRASCSNLAALTYLRLGDFEHAIEYAERTLSLDRRSADNEQISTSLNSIAGICLAAEQPEQAEQYITEAIEIERQLSRPEILAIRLGMASEIYVKLKRGEEALPLAQEAVAIEQTLGDVNRLGIRQSQLAAVCFELHDNRGALQLLAESLSNLRKADNLNSQAIVLNQLGAVTLAMGNTAKAAECYAESATICQQTGNRMVEAKARQQAAAALQAVNPQAALTHLMHYVELSQQLYTEQMAQSLADFNARYEAAQKEHQIALLKEQIAQRHLLIFALSVLLVAAILVIVIIIHRRKFNQLRTKHDHFMVKALIKPEAVADEKPDIRFTPREREVIECCSKGLLAKEIADKLDISERTVQVHKNNIFKKIGVQTTLEMVMYAHKVGLVATY